VVEPQAAQRRYFSISESYPAKVKLEHRLSIDGRALSAKAVAAGLRIAGGIGS
jgi:hypothetical protein